VTAARDVIAKILCDAAGPGCDCDLFRAPCVYYKAADGLLSAPDHVRLELAVLLMLAALPAPPPEHKT